MCVRGALLTLERKTERLTSLTWPLLLSVSGQAPLLRMCGLLNELGRPSEISLLQKVVFFSKSFISVVLKDGCESMVKF